MGSLIDLLSPARVKGFKIVEVLPCMAGPEKIRVIARVKEELHDVLPVIYLYLPQATYNEEASSVSFMYCDHLVTVFGEGKVTVTNLKDEDEARKVVGYVVDLANRAFRYLERVGKPPAEAVKSKPKVSPVKLVELLPRTNCGDCGESSCYSFAIKLATCEKDPSDCPHLERRSEVVKLLHPIII
nr:(Fe-S)-binding protein [Candidatus Freyrarchaeum guaymaensis]